MFQPKDVRQGIYRSNRDEPPLVMLRSGLASQSGISSAPEAASKI